MFSSIIWIQLHCTDVYELNNMQNSVYFDLTHSLLSSTIKTRSSVYLRCSS